MGIDSALDVVVDSQATTRQILTVTELNNAVSSLLERSFPLVWVAGEISSLTRAASGHWYFSLKDRDAQVRCVMFRGRNQLLDWAPREGDKVEARALIGLYAARGDFQLNIEALRRAGSGSLYEAFLRLKEKLQNEGLFAPERKRTLPAFPGSIAIVTSLQAAALRDVLTTLARRAPHVRLYLYPTAVQGADAPAQIAQAIRTASSRAQQGAGEILLVVRGGGSIEDLWAFNDEIVARALAAASIPVVSGIGHETDFTIADFVADVRAPTPTAAAELASPDGPRLRQQLQDRAAALRRVLERRLQTVEQRLDDASQRLKSPAQRWRDAWVQVARLQQRLMRLNANALLAANQRLAQGQDRLHYRRPNLERLHTRLQNLHGRSLQAIRHTVSAQQARLDVSAARLALLNPASALERGYSMTTDASGRIVRNASDLVIGQRVQISFARGAAESTVSKIHPAT